MWQPNRDYSGARSLLTIIGAFGWIGILAGLALIVIGFSDRDGFPLVAAGLSASVSGLVTVALVSVGKAQFDVAENTALMVEFMRQRPHPEAAKLSDQEAQAESGPREVAQIYRGKKIFKTHDGFMSRGRVFTNIEDARDWMDEGMR